MSSFKELGLSPEICQAVEDLGFETPTEVQSRAIPTILASQRDLIALAQTGTGKTGAFGMPVLQQVDANSNNVQVLVLSPTRELAIQIAKDLKSFAKHQKGIKTVAVYGGANISTQIRALNNGCQVVIGTPGRMLDLIRRRKLDVTNVRSLVLDEADEMLNMGFQDDLDAILADTPQGKQTLLFSATMPKQISKMARKYMNNPEEIEVNARNSGALNVEHHYYMVHAKDRYDALKRIADVNPDIYGIIFCRTRRETSEVASKLSKEGYNADLLNGDLSQAQRDEVMNRFRTKELQLLVATDVAARGLDVDNLTHVINYNLPDDLEVYIHRSGRTGRAGNSGIAVSIIHTREMGRIRALEKMSGKEFIKQDVPKGEEVCGVRMMDMVDKLKATEVNEKQIEKYLPQVYEKLADLGWQELIQHFVSMEFNQILEYYQEAGDINASAGRSKNNNNRNNPSRKNNGRSNSGGSGRHAEEGFTRYFLNVGNRDGLNPARLMGVVNEQLNGKKPNFGKIDIQNNFSFFEVEEGFDAKLFDAVNGTQFEGRDLSVELAKPDSNGSGSSSKGSSSGSYKGKGKGGSKSKRGNRKSKGDEPFSKSKGGRIKKKRSPEVYA
ncbi:MAG: DEAD/DEAH box helicase [Gracilimonas sp.]|uniref:DEAD/DEAH box helicase n=1 Tax=Gracilimonas sp. TaxID=1974203 RepID=UPI001B238439|nr:DEAD/DEAH box helicase [Gracilimonas sp.]MBO6586891.1 DEAD/DEAH box helicase [Gracilimonas sp.]MBO6614621.1 DEAD/DEAH box helicase [Gracilimonas sp.]